jgi:outer membrane receptor protein involved in Fe transport
MMRGALALIISMIAAPALGQDSLGQDDIITVYDTKRTVQSAPISVGVLSAFDLETTAFVHPAEALNRTAGVNIHRGSGQEHLTAIRSPVLTGGAGAGSFLYLQDGVPLRSAGFANVNGLFEAGTEFAQNVEVIKGPGPATYGSK